jgi:hypothetical protein
MVHPELCQNGTLRVTVGIRWGYGGGTEGERCGSGIVEECLQCAIFGTQSRPALIVKPKSLPDQLETEFYGTCFAQVRIGRVFRDY